MDMVKTGKNLKKIPIRCLYIRAEKIAPHRSLTLSLSADFQKSVLAEFKNSVLYEEDTITNARSFFFAILPTPLGVPGGTPVLLNAETIEISTLLLNYSQNPIFRNS